MKSALGDLNLVAASDLDEALRLLASDPAWEPIAGGTDLMVLLNAGKLWGSRFVSIRHLPELRSITVLEPEVVLGPAVTYTRIREHPVLCAEFPLLPMAASWTGGIANQNRGTIGGNIVNASPAADSAPPLLVYEATLRLKSVHGERTIPYREFHTGYKQMQLGRGEMVTAIHLPRKFSGWRHYARKVGARKAQAISKVCLHGLLQLEGDTVADIAIAVGSVAPTPIRCTAAENELRGQVISPEILARAKDALRAEIKPIDDIRSTARYRMQVARNLLGDFLTTAYDAR
ncbi:MAG: FAD binding domain-containing protein [Bryobacteraceae bacterium]